MYRVTRMSLCLEKVLYKSRPLYLLHRQELPRHSSEHSRHKHLSHSRPTHYSRAGHQLCSFCQILVPTSNVNVQSAHRRFYSNFKDDDLVKSWIKEIKEDFDKKKSTTSESGEEYFKDIEATSDVSVEKVQLDESSSLSHDEKVSIEKLKEFANKFAGIELTEKDLNPSQAFPGSTDMAKKEGTLEGFTKEEMIRMLKDKGAEITEADSAEASSSDSDSSSDSGFDSDSDLLSSSSESDSSDEESIGDKKASDDATIKDKPVATLEGFTREEMVRMLKNTEIKEMPDSNLDEKTNDLSINDISDEASISSKSVKDDLGIAATKIGKDGLEENWAVVEIDDFVDITPEPDVEEPWIPPISLEHGKTGVFDVEDLVTLLRSANASDVVVIRLPKAAQLGDHMVIASAKSQRHLTAMSKDVQWIYKKRSKKRRAHLRIEGEKSNWQAMDTGNIFLHLFLPEVRELYDLETLWTVGPDFDEKCRQQGTDPYVFSMDDLPWLKDLEAGNQRVVEEERDAEKLEETEKSKKLSRN